MCIISTIMFINQVYIVICAAAALGKLLQHDPGVASCMFAVMAYVAVFCCVVVAEGCCFKTTVTVTALFLLLLHFHSYRIRDRCMNIKYVVLREYN